MCVLNDFNLFVFRDTGMMPQSSFIEDEHGDSLFYAERPAYIAQNGLSALLGLIVAFVFGVFIFGSASASAGVTRTLFYFVAIVGSLSLYFAISLGNSKTRDITVYYDESKQKKFLKIIEENRIGFPIAKFSVFDDKDKVLFRAKKYFFRNLWQINEADGSLICSIKNIDRPFLIFHSGQSRKRYDAVSEFELYYGAAQVAIGVFTRKSHSLKVDKSSLDMSQDRHLWIDRQIALGIGVLLDFVESFEYINNDPI